MQNAGEFCERHVCDFFFSVNFENMTHWNENSRYQLNKFAVISCKIHVVLHIVKTSFIIVLKISLLGYSFYSVGKMVETTIKLVLSQFK